MPLSDDNMEIKVQFDLSDLEAAADKVNKKIASAAGEGIYKAKLGKGLTGDKLSGTTEASDDTVAKVVKSSFSSGVNGAMSAVAKDNTIAKVVKTSFTTGINQALTTITRDSTVFKASIGKFGRDINQVLSGVTSAEAGEFGKSRNLTKGEWLKIAGMYALGAYAVKKFIGAINEAGDTLKNYNAKIFSISTEIEYKWVGFYYRMGKKLEGVLPDLMDSISDLSMAFIDLAASVLKVVGPKIAKAAKDVAGVVKEVAGDPAQTKSWIDMFKSGFKGALAGGVAGSVVPGVGTFTGAGVGLLAGMTFGGSDPEENRREMGLAGDPIPPWFRGGMMDKWRFGGQTGAITSATGALFGGPLGALAGSGIASALSGNAGAKLFDSIKNIEEYAKDIKDNTDDDKSNGLKITTAMFSGLKAWSHEKDAKDFGEVKVDGFKKVPNPANILKDMVGLDPAKDFFLNGAGANQNAKFPGPERQQNHFQAADKIVFEFSDLDRINMAIQNAVAEMISKTARASDSRFALIQGGLARITS